MSQGNPGKFDANRLAEKLFALRNAAACATTDEFPLPPDFHTAMEAQRALAKLEGFDANAWKLALSPEKRSVIASLHPLVEQPSELTLRFFPGLKMEAEIAVRLGGSASRPKTVTGSFHLW